MGGTEVHTCAQSLSHDRPSRWLTKKAGLGGPGSGVFLPLGRKSSCELAVTLTAEELLDIAIPTSLWSAQLALALHLAQVCIMSAAPLTIVT